MSQTEFPSLTKTWLWFWLVLLLITFSVRIVSSWIMVPGAIWNMSWWWGVRFDLAISALLAGLTVLAMWLCVRVGVKLTRRGWLAPGAFVLLGAHLGDWLYWRESGRHVGYEARELVNSLDSLIGTLLQQWPLVLGVVLVTIVVGTISWVPSKQNRRGLRIEAGLFIVVLGTTLAVRGNVVAVPQGPHDALRLPTSGQAVAALNGAYGALHSLQTDDGELVHFPMPWLGQQQAEEIVKQTYASRPPAESSSIRKVNVVFVMLESWSSYHMQPLRNGKEVTPNFNRIASKSLSSKEMIAGGLRTTEGLFALFCSYQNPLGQTLAKSSLAYNEYGCLPEHLRQAGWSTAFFQGSHENTGGVGAYAQSMGFSISEGKDSIDTSDQPLNSWGVYDEALYKHVLARMDQLPEPMLVGINTNTTHDSQLYDNAIKLTEGKTPTAVRKNVLHLADHELGGFVEALESRQWELPWMLVLVADHTAHVDGSNLERFQVPFALYFPQQSQFSALQRIPHHRDIAPTVADILDFEMPGAMGHSLLDPGAPQIAEYFVSGTLSWMIGDERLVEFPVSDPEVARCYNWRKGPDLKTVVSCDQSDQTEMKAAYALTKQAQSALFREETLGLFD